MTTISTLRDPVQTRDRVSGRQNWQSGIKGQSGLRNKAETSEEFHTARVTKHDRILTLLSRREGASIQEMMQASGWQQHSVRGFLAGTVKKKLGFALTSSKLSGDVRRYRIETRRGR